MKPNRTPYWPLTIWLGLAVAVFGASLSLPLLRHLIERSMTWHMVIQMPLLVAGGWLCAGVIGQRRWGDSIALWNRYGLAGFMAAQLIVAYWMLPVAIDRAVVVPSVDALKVASLFFAGVALGHSFRRAPLAIQLFFVGYSVSMLLWLGLYFTTTDARLCNAYSLSSQVGAGRGVIALGVAAGWAWLVHALWLGGRRAWEAYLRP